MSEYQYYEFRAIDRPLSERQLDELGKLSSRAEITPTSFTNTYNYGDFRGNPDVLMEKYFDAFVYVANWGTHRLMFRVPRRFLDVKQASLYDNGEELSIRAKKDHVVLEFLSQEEDGGGWENGEEWMPDLIGLREDLLRGDFRCLYLGWLASIQFLDPEYDEEEFDTLEPPVPPGLAKLSAPLVSLADFLRLDDALLKAAAARGKGQAPGEPSREALARWLGKLPAAEKNAILLRFVTQEDETLLRRELMQRFRESAAKGKKPRGEPDTERRTVGQLLAARDAIEAKQRRKEAGEPSRRAKR